MKFSSSRLDLGKLCAFSVLIERERNNCAQPSLTTEEELSESLETVSNNDTLIGLPRNARGWQQAGRDCVRRQGARRKDHIAIAAWVQGGQRSFGGSSEVGVTVGHRSELQSPAFVVVLAAGFGRRAQPPTV